MIVLTVLSFHGAPAPGLSARFDELGGSIGRADTNQLVLPDPERSISRVQARVLFRNGGYALVDSGSTPTCLNGVPLDNGREQPLQPGDQLQIGGYLLQVSAAASAPVIDDPFADLFGPAAGGLAIPAAAPPPMRSILSMGAAPVPAPVPAGGRGALSPGHIPDDWNPFAPDAAAPAPRPAPAAPLLPNEPFAAMAPAGGESLDDLFGLSGLAASDPLGTAPRPAPAPSTLELGSELQTPMPLPPAALPATAPRTAPPPAAPLPAGAVFSWDTPAADASPLTLILPKAVRSAAAPAQPAPGPSAAPLRPAPQPAAPAAGDAELLAALHRGLGAPGLRIDALTPELMEQLGTLLRESTRGAVELLLARAALKREMRAEMTMIVARENNPLKFSPGVDVALQHLLGPPVPGFMPSGPAVRDAFDDLRAHQLGVMAGMKAALEGVLQRFDPQQLEGKLTRRSAIDSLIPSTRKARLWESFNELFNQLQAEAQDDFDELFGKAFLRAYEAQLDRLSSER